MLRAAIQTAVTHIYKFKTELLTFYMDQFSFIIISKCPKFVKPK